MSDIMDHGVIGMPFEMAMYSDLSRWLFYQRAQDILQERDALRIELSLLRAALNEIASWNEGPEVSSSFDEPHAAKVARDALKMEPTP